MKYELKFILLSAVTSYGRTNLPDEVLGDNEYLRLVPIHALEEEDHHI